MGDLFATYDIWGAFWMTIQLSVLSAIGSLLIGTIVAVLRIVAGGSAAWIGTSTSTSSATPRSRC